MNSRRKLTTTQRGLGWRHQQRVAQLKRELVEGSPCWWCGEGLYLSQALHGDHEIPRSLGGQLPTRLLHAECNSARGDGRRDHLRPAITGQPISQRRRTDLGRRVLRWPNQGAPANCA